MAQAVPSNILYAQAMSLIEQLRKDYAANKFRTPDEVSEIIKEIIQRFDSGVGFALTQFETLHKGEPPHSAKMNRFYASAEQDLNILQDQIDLLRASTIFQHNFTKTEVLKAKYANSRLQNKIKTLALYSQSDDPTIIKLGDGFLNDEFIDWELVDQSQRAAILTSGYIGLAPDEQNNDLLQNATIKILPSSNGFVGNNQEIDDPLSAGSDPLTNDPVYTFVAESNRAAEPEALLDSEPNTWMEYEYYKVADADRVSAKNFNFYYKANNENTSVLGVEVSSSGRVDWAKGPRNDVLSLDLEVDLGQVEPINIVTLSAFGLSDNRNNPIKVVSASISETGTEWELLTPTNVWIVNAIDKKLTATDSENATVGAATWTTNGVYTRYLRFKIEQPTPIDSNIGHLYYINPTQGANNASQIVDTDDIDITVVGTNAPKPISEQVLQRVEGPIPPIEAPDTYYGIDRADENGLVQKREFFKGKRWCIGLRDIDIKANIYKEKSVFISKRFNIPGTIDRVALEADVVMPSSFSQSEPWIKFFISPDEGANWYQISRIQDDFLSIPEIIAFNDPIPAALREPGVSYVDLPNAKIDSLRFKAEFQRPSSESAATPVLKSYTLKIKRR